MRAKLERWLAGIWYGGQPVPWYLSALEPIYARLKPTPASLTKPGSAQDSMVPAIIVIGNLTAGGAGKTPLLIALVQSAKAQGIKVGVISRGYGRNSKQLLRVHADSDWRLVGDEPLLIAKRTGVPVCVANDRMAAARALAGECTLLFSDDGMQNPQLERAVEILVIDGARGFGNRRLLPAGPCRSAAENYQARFPLRVINLSAEASKSPLANDPGAWTMRLKGDVLLSLDGKAQQSLSAIYGTKVRALAGIGNPTRFYAALRAAGAIVEPIHVADHGLVRLQDGDSRIIMTEKDALKYAGSAELKCGVWYLPVSAELTAPVA